MREQFTLNVNGAAYTVDAEPDMPLLYALKNELALRGPKFGCGLAQCGACAARRRVHTVCSVVIILK